MTPIWLQQLLGGRPMTLVGKSFTDVVSGKVVFDFIDCRGRLWMANGRWSLFRVQKGLTTGKGDGEWQRQSA